MNSILVGTNNSYNVLIGNGILNTIGQEIAKIKSKCKVLIVHDDIVNNLYGKVVSKSIKDAGFDVYEYEFKNGEKSKNLNTYADILSFIASSSFSRSDLIVALGGGVCGDLAGFVAASYMRGIDYIQVPTTLLAMIDSSVGGKTAVDLKEGKNLVGAFYQPKLVLADTDTLLTLPCTQYTNGMGEGIKYAVLEGGELLEIVKGGVMCSKKDAIERFVYLCVDSKRRIVEEDEKENNLRRLLNLGHTFAHAIEKLSNYTINHGVAVCYGLEIVAKIARKQEKLSQESFRIIMDMLDKYDVKWNDIYQMDEMIKELTVDKKVERGYLNIVIPYDIADCRIEKIELSKLKEILSC